MAFSIDVWRPSFYNHIMNARIKFLLDYGREVLKLKRFVEWFVIYSDSGRATSYHQYVNEAIVSITHYETDTNKEDLVITGV